MALQGLCVSIIALFLGLIMLFAGYHLFLMLLPIIGFTTGFFIGASAVSLLTGDVFIGTVPGWIVGFIVGLIFAILSYFFYFSGVAFLSGTAGYALGTGLIFAFSNDSPIFAFIVGIASAVLAAYIVLALNVQKWVITAITAILGSSAIIMSVTLLFNKVNLADLGINPIRPVWNDSPIWFVVWLLLIVIGVSTQLTSTRGYVRSNFARRL